MKNLSKAGKQGFFFPARHGKRGVTIEANSLEEAQKIYNGDKPEVKEVKKEEKADDFSKVEKLILK